MIDTVFITAAGLMAISTLTVLVAKWLSKGLPYRSAVVESAELKEVKNGRVVGVYYRVQLRLDSGSEITCKFTFLSSKRAKVESSWQYRELIKTYGNGRSVQVRYVPFFEWIGYIPPSSKFDGNSLYLLFGFILSSGLLLVAGQFFL